MAKKKGKARSSTHMTSAERTRAKMRSQPQAEEARREAEANARAKPAEDARATGQVPAADSRSQIDDIDAQIAELERRRAELSGEHGTNASEDAADKRSGSRKEPGAQKPRSDAREAYPGGRKLRRAQGKLERQASALDENPTVSRLACAVIDFFVGGVCLLGPAYLPYYYLSGSNTLGSLSDYLSLGQSAALPVGLALVGLALGIVYYVVVPWRVWPGQTLGKHLGHIRIVRRSGRAPGLGTLLLRQLVCVMFLELGFTCDLLLLPQLLELLTGGGAVGSSLQLAGLGISAVSLVMFFVSRQGLALHDRFAGTRVVRL